MNQPWSYMYSPSLSPLPPPSPPDSSGSSQWPGSYQARALVSCIPPGLVICFTIDNIHAVLSKQPTLAFSQSPKVCSVHLCLFLCPAHRVIITILHPSKFHTHVLACCNVLYLSGLLHSVQWAPVSSISLEPLQMNSFQQLSNIPWCICTTASLSIHLLMMPSSFSPHGF